MTKKETEKVFDKIIKGMKIAISEVYEEARKTGIRLVISENGKVKKIKVS